MSRRVEKVTVQASIRLLTLACMLDVIYNNLINEMVEGKVERVSIPYNVIRKMRNVINRMVKLTILFNKPLSGIGAWNEIVEVLKKPESLIPKEYSLSSVIKCKYLLTEKVVLQTYKLLSEVAISGI